MEETDHQDSAEEDAPISLTPAEARVLGSIVEKAMTTPDHYPLTFNALVAACNQKSNREPVVEYDDDVVNNALDRLREKELCTRVAVAGARVPKYRHTLPRGFPMLLDTDKMEVATTDEAEKLSRRRIAVLGVLLLRGQQTLAEVRTRTERMYHFADLDAVQRTLDDLAAYRIQPLSKFIPAGSGRRVPTYIQLLTDPGETATAAAPLATTTTPNAREEIEPSWREKVESDIAELRAEIRQLKEALGEE
ncbi:MAG: hypothetical protein ACI9UA_003385 [Pseudoalteromonas tetraodonis]|jgi:uncharacterized protein YceH (UPF0502 family)